MLLGRSRKPVYHARDRGLTDLYTCCGQASCEGLGGGAEVVVLGVHQKCGAQSREVSKSRHCISIWVRARTQVGADDLFRVFREETTHSRELGKERCELGGRLGNDWVKERVGGNEPGGLPAFVVAEPQHGAGGQVAPGPATADRDP